MVSAERVVSEVTQEVGSEEHRGMSLLKGTVEAMQRGEKHCTPADDKSPTPASTQSPERGGDQELSTPGSTPPGRLRALSLDLVLRAVESNSTRETI